MTEDMLKRLALALDRGSHTNEYAKLQAIRAVVRLLEALTDQDIADLLGERITQRCRIKRDLEAISFAFRAGRNPTQEQIEEFNRRFR